jgi:hypothetical protein
VKHVRVGPTQIEAGGTAGVYLFSGERPKGIEKTAFCRRQERRHVAFKNIRQSLQDRSVQDGPSVFKVSAQGTLADFEAVCQFCLGHAGGAIAQKRLQFEIYFTGHL